MADWVLKGSLKGPQGDPGETPDLSGYATTESLTQAVAAEADAREKADELLQADVDGKLAADDIVAGENVSVSLDAGKVTVSAEPGLPEGGTEGQVLTKTSDGEAWQDAPEPDMTGVMKLDGSDGVVVNGNSYPEKYCFGSGLTGGVTIYNRNEETGAVPSVIVSNGANTIQINAGDTPIFSIEGKYVKSITDDASSGDTYAIATAKAVKDYVDANAMPSVVPVSQGGTGVTTEDALSQLVFSHAPEASPTQAGVVKTLSDEDFCAYMGMEYDPADWS